MITVNGDELDYAIMKQVQQLRLKHPKMTVVQLDQNANFGALFSDEPLYLISHGTHLGLKDIKSSDLLGWLTSPKSGVPRSFNGGIVILSCYSGLQLTPQPSLASFLASGLRGLATPRMAVEGATGYSYGSPEFRNSGRSSVLPVNLGTFYYANDIPAMVEAWLKLKPTHTGGVLADKLGITVGIATTIGQQLSGRKQTPEETALGLVSGFATEVKDVIEKQLAEIISFNITGDSVVAKADYFAANGTDTEVIKWNLLIDAQYKLFSDYYLWASPLDAFTVARVPA